MKQSKPPINFNDIKIEYGSPSDLREQTNFSLSIENPKLSSIDIVFKNLEDELVKLITKYKNGYIFGCVAWLTSPKILEALSKCNNVQLLIQKEDFLRPDGFYVNNFKRWLLENYSKIRFTTCKHDCNEYMRNISFLSDYDMYPIRCIGNHNTSQSKSPRMHHKFMVFCKKDKKITYNPTAVWTGSFNFTLNAVMSFENAIILKDKKGNNPILNAYLNEHHQLYVLSEPLDWTSEWIAPEYRIGT